MCCNLPEDDPPPKPSKGITVLAEVASMLLCSIIVLMLLYAVIFMAHMIGGLVWPK